MVKLLILLLLACAFSAGSCTYGGFTASARTVSYATAPATCTVTKVNPVWYSGETITVCTDDQGKVRYVNDAHEDLSIVAGFGSLMIAVAGIAVGFGL